MLRSLARQSEQLANTYIRYVTEQRQTNNYHHLTTTLHLTLKMTTAQGVETSVTDNSLSKDYLHPDNHAK